MLLFTTGAFLFSLQNLHKKTRHLPCIRWKGFWTCIKSGATLSITLFLQLRAYPAWSTLYLGTHLRMWKIHFFKLRDMDFLLPYTCLLSANCTHLVFISICILQHIFILLNIYSTKIVFTHSVFIALDLDQTIIINICTLNLPLVSKLLYNLPICVVIFLYNRIINKK